MAKENEQEKEPVVNEEQKSTDNTDDITNDNTSNENELSILKEEVANITGELASQKAENERLLRELNSRNEEYYKIKNDLADLQQQFKNGGTITEEKEDVDFYI